MMAFGFDNTSSSRGASSLICRSSAHRSCAYLRAHVFDAVLCQNSVTTSDFTSKDDLSALEHCFHQGWLYADNFDSKEVYVLASPLHRWFLETRLFENRMPVPVVKDF